MKKFLFFFCCFSLFFSRQLYASQSKKKKVQSMELHSKLDSDSEKKLGSTLKNELSLKKKTKKKKYNPENDGWTKGWIRYGVRKVISNKKTADAVVDGGHVVVEKGGSTLVYGGLGALILSQFKRIPLLAFKNPLYGWKKKFKKIGFIFIATLAGVVYHQFKNNKSAAEHREEIRQEGKEERAEIKKTVKNGHLELKDEIKLNTGRVISGVELACDQLQRVDQKIDDARKEATQNHEVVMRLMEVAAQDNVYLKKIIDEVGERQKDLARGQGELVRGQKDLQMLLREGFGSVKTGLSGVARGVNGLDAKVSSANDRLDQQTGGIQDLQQWIYQQKMSSATPMVPLEDSSGTPGDGILCRVYADE